MVILKLIKDNKKLYIIVAYSIYPFFKFGSHVDNLPDPDILPAGVHPVPGHGCRGKISTPLHSTKYSSTLDHQRMVK